MVLLLIVITVLRYSLIDDDGIVVVGDIRWYLFDSSDGEAIC